MREIDLKVNQPMTQPASYWITPVKSDEEWSVEEVIETYVEKERVYALSDRAFRGAHVKQGDFICFYRSARGVVAHAKVISSPEAKPDSPIRNPEIYPWVFDLSDIHVYLDKPIVISAKLRSTLDAFKNKDRNKSWAWFVQTTRRISSHDFSKLTSGH